MNTRPAPLFPPIPKATGSVKSLQAGGAPVWVNFEDFGSEAVTESWPWESASATLKLKCYWQDRYAVVRGLRGGVVVAGNSWKYYTMARYPYSTNLFCTSIPSIRGLNPYVDENGLCQYQYAIFDAYYGVIPYQPPGEEVTDPSGVPMTDTRYKGSASVVAPPTGSYVYTSGSSAGKPVPNSAIGVIQGKVEISMKRMMVPFPALQMPMYLIGCVNAYPLTFGDNTFPVGCLLCAGFTMEPNPDPSTGYLAWNYEFQLIGNWSIQWNAVLDPSGNAVIINTNASGSGLFPYPYEDLSLLRQNTLQFPAAFGFDGH